MIEVSDDGIGMEPEVLARALEPSFTTKGKGEGSGVGPRVGADDRHAPPAAASRSSRSPGEGTTVRLRLPVTLPDSD